VYVSETKTGNNYETDISLVEFQDYKAITKENYFFNWKLEQDKEVYKICIKDKSKILGLVSIERIPEEWRIHVRLLSVSSDNKGTDKKYERIIGNLLTYISKIAVKEYAELACVSLKPKDVLVSHYVEKYGMNVTGMTLSLELAGIFNLIEIYDNEK